MTKFIIAFAPILSPMFALAEQDKWFADHFDKFLKCEAIDVKKFEKNGDKFGLNVEIAIRGAGVEAWMVETHVNVSAKKGERGSHGQSKQMAVDISGDYKRLRISASERDYQGQIKNTRSLVVNRADLTVKGGSDGTRLGRLSLEGNCTVVPAEQGFPWAIVDNQI